MIRIKTCFFFILFALFVSSPVPAFYEYVDEHGVTRYTDDINEVPEDQRYGKEEYQETETAQPEADDTVVPETQTKTGSESPASGEKAGKDSDYDATLNALKQRREDLVRERAAIEKEDDRLLKNKLKLKPGEDIEEYNEEVSKLRQRTRELEKKREEFNEKINKLNAEIEQYNEKVANKLKSQLEEYENLKNKDAK